MSRRRERELEFLDVAVELAGDPGDVARGRWTWTYQRLVSRRSDLGAVDRLEVAVMKGFYACMFVVCFALLMFFVGMAWQNYVNSSDGWWMFFDGAMVGLNFFSCALYAKHWWTYEKGT